MPRRTSIVAALSFYIVLGVFAKDAEAVAFRTATTGGVMQQPTSNYYLAIYGGLIDISTDSGGFTVRLSYLERPKYESGGFVDQEAGVFVAIGGLVAGDLQSGLHGYFGMGRMQGYLRADDDNTTDTRRRGFSLPGPTATFEYLAHLGPIAVGVGHQTFVGYVDNTELNARVAWPYNYFQTMIGVIF